MASLISVRADLATSLRDAQFDGRPLRVYDHVPESLSPPCVAVQAADPYLTPGETFGDDWAVSLAVYLLVKGGTNERQLSDLDQMLEAVLPHFEGAEGEPWAVEVGAPVPFSVNNNDFLGCRIAASNHFTLG